MNKEPSFKIYNSIHEVTPLWDILSKSVFLNTPFLIAQEEALPSNMQIYYIGFFQNGNLIGKTIFQRIELDYNTLFGKKKRRFYKLLLSYLNVNMLCVGNIKLTGENAFVLDESISFKSISYQLEKALAEVRRILKQDKKKIKLILIKDFYPDSLKVFNDYFKKYNQLEVEPNMIMKLPKNWLTLDDYMDSLRSKYKVRVRRAFKKIEDIIFRELEYTNIQDYDIEINELYHNVINNLEFTPYILPPEYFGWMKKNMKKDFRFFGGFMNDKMVCFYTIIHNKSYMETGFLGYQSDLQQEKQLYLNMLYRMIDYGIQNDFDSINFARSALEIKSSVGAKPLRTFGFLKHTNPFLNKGLKFVFKQIYSPKNWVERNPFK